jgi:hypothetical protein
VGRAVLIGEKRGCRVMTVRIVLLACLAATLFMAGAIAVVQFVHYPLFAKIDRGSFCVYHAEHSRLITPVVFLPMVIELATSGWLVVYRPNGSSGWLAGMGFAAALIAWAITGAWAVPLHRRLAHGFDQGAQQSLLHANSFRAVAWCVHSLIVLIMTERVLQCV